MSTIKVSLKDDFAILEFNRPKGHALNTQMVTDLRQAFEGFTDSDAIRGVILTGTGTIFCAGIDVVELFDYDKAEFEAFWQAFDQLLKDMVAFPKPLVAAVNGHAPAGGCVLAMCCDYRVMADGKGRIGLNEIAVGIVIPAPIVELARQVVGDARSAEMIYHAALLLPEEAAAFGLVQAVVPYEDLLAAAESKLRAWLDLPQAPWRETKSIFRRPLLKAMDGEFSDDFDATLRGWWSDESRARVSSMLEKLKKK